MDSGPRTDQGRTKYQALRTRDYVDSLNHVALENLIDDLDAVEHLCEDGVLVVEPRVVDEIDEDLRVARVVSPRRDADRAAHVRPQSDFIAHEARVADVLVGAGAAPLDHEVRHDPVEREPVIVPGLREMREAEDRGRRLRREQRQLERADAANGDARSG